MKRISATMTQRSQVTVPAEVRRVLGVGPRDRVVFVVDGSDVKITREPYTLDMLFGSVKRVPGAPLDIEEQIRIANEERAERIIDRMAEGLE